MCWARPAVAAVVDPVAASAGSGRGPGEPTRSPEPACFMRSDFPPRPALSALWGRWEPEHP